MHHALLPTALLLVLASAAHAVVERTVERTFTVGTAAAVEVDILSGPISVEVGPAGTVQARLEQRIRADTPAEADAVLARYEVTVGENDGRILVRVQRRGTSWSWRDSPLELAAHLVVPADARLNLDTSGGPIVVEGLLSGSLRADTSGGAIEVDGGSGSLNLDTSGGSIRVGQALGSVRADTSGGDITIAYVGPNAPSVVADTSGGSITVGLDPAGRYSLVGDTSGGRVSVDGLPFEARTTERTRIVGNVNGGGASVTADTSGGNVRFRAANAP